MHVEFGPRGILQIDNARVTFRNFAGRGDRYNAPGKRNFAIIIEDEATKDLLVNDVNEFGVGWNVKIKPPREEGDTPFMFLKVNLKFNDRGPAIYLKSGKAMNRISEEEVGMLDDIDIASVDLDIRPYDDETASGPFRSAYLQSMCVTQDLSRDRFAQRYSDETGE